MPRDALGPLINELRTYLAANGGTEFAAVPVRGGDPGVGDAPPLVVLSHIAFLREHRTGLIRQRIQSTSYASTRLKAAQLAGLVSDAFHDRKPRVRAGTLIYETWEEIGAQPDTDTATGWPAEIGFYSAIVAAQAVA